MEAKVEKVLKNMTLKEKAGQLVQLSIVTVEDDTHEALDPAKLDKIIGEYKVGSILNVMHDAAHTREQTAAMIRQIQDKSMELLGIPCIYGLDMIHGASYLVEGSLYPQEINLGATFNREYARMMGPLPLGVLARNGPGPRSPLAASVGELGRRPVSPGGDGTRRDRCHPGRRSQSYRP